MIKPSNVPKRIGREVLVKSGKLTNSHGELSPQQMSYIKNSNVYTLAKSYNMEGDITICTFSPKDGVNYIEIDPCHIKFK